MRTAAAAAVAAAAAAVAVASGPLRGSAGCGESQTQQWGSQRYPGQHGRTDGQADGQAHPRRRIRPRPLSERDAERAAVNLFAIHRLDSVLLSAGIRTPLRRQLRLRRRVGEAVAAGNAPRDL